MATVNWRIEYDNDTGAGDEGFAEYWTVTNGTVAFRTSDEDAAKRLVALLQDMPWYNDLAPDPEPNQFKPGTLVMDGPRIGIFVRPLDEGRVLVQFAGPLPECVRETELVLLSEEILKAVRRLKGEASSAEERIGINYVANELLDLGLL